MKHNNTIIIGAGPAGLMGGIAAADVSDNHICILEKNHQPAKKLLIAGSGRCNITHAGPIENFPKHYGQHAQFVKPALFRFTNTDLADFFAARKLPLKELNSGKLFPVTESSRDVLCVLLEECRKKKVKIKDQAAVQKIEKIENEFHVQTEHETYFAQKVIIATGGKSYPTTGSTGDGFQLAKSLGHTITEVAPALTPVIVRDYQFTDCAGLSFENVRIQVIRNGKKHAEHQGDILFTHHGLSGPGILDISREILPLDSLKISFVDFPNPEMFEKQLLNDFKTMGKRTIRNIIAPMYLSERLVNAILRQLEIDTERTVAEVDKETRKKLATAIAAGTFIVKRLGDFHEAMVTRGGISLSEVNRNTMESRLIPGLFFCGEVLDIDGDTGGYNLQFAFSSGKMSGTQQGTSHNPLTSRNL